MGWIDSFRAEFEKTFIRDDRYKVFVTGFKNTLLITLVSLVVGLVAGILIAIIRYGYSQMKKRKPVTVPQKLVRVVLCVVDKILGRIDVLGECGKPQIQGAAFRLPHQSSTEGSFPAH